MVGSKKVKHQLNRKINKADFKKIYKSDATVEEKLKYIHENMFFNSNLKDKEIPEQLMSLMYIRPADKVLEIGGNAGRNTCVISCILKDESNLVTLESNPKTVKRLIENRDKNEFKFKIEDSAISRIKLIQLKMQTKPSDVLEEGWEWVKTITWEDFKKKYDVKFNVLVADCEGALYYILRDEPTFLDGIKTIIMENDFEDKEQEDFVFNVFKEKGFKIIYEKGIKNWQDKGINKKNFYVVLKRD